MNTIVLGAGIAGLLAAWACEQLGKPFRLLDAGPLDALPRLIAGCVYLHDRCDLPPHAVRSQTLSTMVLPIPPQSPLATMPPHVLYHRKIWGAAYPYIPNSVQRLPLFEPKVTTIFSMNDALAFLTDRYRTRIEAHHITRENILQWVQDSYIVSTIPLGVLLPDTPRSHTPLYIWQTALPSPDGAVPLAYTLYNVDPATPWYRQSTMFGYASMEFMQPVMPGLAVFKKIVSATDADPFEQANPRVLLTGRWGRWSREFLSHVTYRQVRHRFESGAWV